MRRPQLISIVLASALVLAACGGYSSEFRANYLAGCRQTGGSPEYCECILEHLEEHGPEDEEAITAQDHTEAIRACR